jgi:hypothetical protein
VDLYVTSRAVGVLSVLIVLRAGWLNRADVVGHAMAGKTKLIDRSKT